MGVEYSGSDSRPNVVTSLGEVRTKALGWVSGAETSPWRYRYTHAPTAEAILYPSLYAILALELFDALPDSTSSGLDPGVAAIQQCQDEASGYFRDPRATYVRNGAHDENYTAWHLTSCALQALDALGARPRYPLKFLEPFVNVEYTREWLTTRDMRAAWRESNTIMSLLAGLHFNWITSGDRAWLETYDWILGWLDEEQDPGTGFWGPNRGSGLINGMAATYHFLMFFYAVGREVRYADRIIDSTLKLQLQEGHFAPVGGSSCIDLDGIDILVSLSWITDYRLEDVRSASVRLYDAIARMQNPDGGFPEHSWSGLTVGGLLPLALSWARHRCKKTYVWQGRQFMKHLLAPRHRMYSGSIEQCVSGMYESNIWSAWFRPLALAIVADRFPTDVPAPGFTPRFRRLPGLGYTMASKRG